MSHQVATTVRSFCFGLYCSAFLSNCEKYWEFLKRNLKAKLFIKGCLKPEVPTSRLRTSTSSHFSFRELSSAVYSAKVRRRDWLGEGGWCAGGGRGGGRESKEEKREALGRGLGVWLSIPITHSPCCLNSQRWGHLYSQDSRPMNIKCYSRPP